MVECSSPSCRKTKTNGGGYCHCIQCDGSTRREKQTRSTLQNPASTICQKTSHPQLPQPDLQSLFLWQWTAGTGPLCTGWAARRLSFSLKQADVIINAYSFHSRWYEFYKPQRFIELGYRSTQDSLPAILSAIHATPQKIHPFMSTSHHPVWGKRSADEAVPCKTKLFDLLSVTKSFLTASITAENLRALASPRPQKSGGSFQTPVHQ